MKQILFTCFTCMCLLWVCSAHAQGKTVTLNKSNVPLTAILDEIESQSGYLFLYNKQVVGVDRAASLNVTKAPLTDALEKLFAGTDIAYTIKGQQIVLTKRETAAKESRKADGVQGRVLDRKTKEPIVGATVIVEGTTKGTTTDSQGRFGIEGNKNLVLSISYIGYTTQTVRAAAGTEIEVYLTEDVKLVDEVVVVGYGTVSRRNLTTAIAQVKPDDVPKAANSNISQMLLGRAAGLQATVNSSQPDGKVNISIRGAGNPIYVVDGIVMPSNTIGLGSATGLPSNVNRAGLAGLNPADIESVEVLKDASAAIYGIGAADGVILITTKKGSEGAPRISYEGSYTFTRNYKYLDVLDAQEYMNIANVYSKENYLYNNKQYPYGGLAYDGRWTPVFSPEEIAGATTTDWTDYVLRSGYSTNHNLTVSGGTKHVTYYMGGSYFDQKGTVSNSGMTKYTFRGNLGVQLFPFLKLSSAFNANQNHYTNGMVGDDVGNRGNTAGGSLSSALLYPSYLPLRQADGSYTIFNSVPNPASYDDIQDKTKQNDYMLNFTADLNIWKNIITLKGVYGINQENMRRSTYVPSSIYFDRMYKSRGNIGSERRRNQTMEAMLQFSKRFADIIQVDALVGMGKYLEDYEGYSISYEDTNDLINEHNISSAAGKITPASYTGKNQKRSQFAKLSVDLLDRYVVAATLRRDGTDKFFPNKKYALFPSVSAAWKISNESFLRDVEWVSLLKIRASWGKSGQDNLGSSLYGVYKPSDFKVTFNNNSTFYIPYLLMSADYPDVSWQKTTMKNIGVDFYLFDDRLSGSFDLYRNDVTDLLGNASTSPLAIFSSRPINGAHFYRRGWEITLNSVNLKGKFEWRTNLTLSRVQQFWKERMPNYDYQAYQQRDDEPLAAMYYYKIDGYINMDRSNMPESQKSLQATAQMPGCPIIDDKNGDGVIDINDIHMRNTTPDLYMGFGNTFVYKNFDLDIFMYGQFGAYKYNMALSAAQAGPLVNTPAPNTNKYAYRLWNSQINPNGTRPGIAYSKMGALPGGCGVNADMENASFMRIRNITLGYTIQGKLFGPVQKYIKSIRVYFDVQNPFVITKYTGFDPEIYTGQNEARGQFPQVRSFSLGAKINF